MLVIVGSVFSVISYTMQIKRLENEIEIYRNELGGILENYQKDLFDENEELFTGFLNGEVESAELYHTIYTFISSQTVKGEMLLFDKNSELNFTTNETFNEDQSFMNYIHIAIKNVSKKDDLPAQKVFRRLDGESYLLLISPISDIKDFEGYSVVAINDSQIRKINSESSIAYVLYDKYKNTLASTSNKLIDSKNGKFQIDELSNKSEHENTNFTYSSAFITNYLYLTVYEENQSYSSILFRSFTIIWVVAIILLVQSYYFSNKFSNSIGYSLQELTEEIEKVKENPHHRIKISTDDEFEDVAGSINMMLEQLESFNAENLYLTNLNIETEKKKLEAQFNPHFLSNTLEAIRASIYIDPSVAEKLINNMVGILRYSIDEQQVNTTLGEDEVYLRHYLDIQKERFDEFEYEINFDSESKLIFVPKLFILPLVENSLKYGFRVRRDLRIIILARHIKDGKTLIEVKDNALALRKNECDILNDKLRSKEINGNHHGLKNSNDRLKLLYPNALMEISVDDKYTTVTIEIKGETDNV